MSPSKPNHGSARPQPKFVSIRKPDNNFQRAEVIKRNREKRTQYGQFLVEGVAQINIACKHGWKVVAFLYDGSRPLSQWAQQLLRDAPAEQHWELSPDLLAQLSEKDEPSEILAIFESRRLTPDAIKPRPDGLVVVFDRPSSPGNLGSSIRSADAFGADGIIVTGHAVDIYDPFVVRGSMGAIFGLPVATAQSHAEVLDWVTKARSSGFPYRVVGSSGKGEQLLTEVDLSGPTVLVLGNETVGMSRGYWDMCDSVVKIPIGGELSSINVSCAASILLYEVTRQRIAKQG
jgi:23S rRNA (uridine2479-2'-O)-methyltransferase